MSMKKTDTFFIISNFNTDPEYYTLCTENYHIYDQSNDSDIKELLSKKYKKISFSQHTGHNISDYFSFFIDNYDNLPEWMMLAKGNMIGRHVSSDYFNRVIDNKKYTFLYNDSAPVEKSFVQHHLAEGLFLEINDSWYIKSKENRYFSSFNELLKFLFKEPIIPKWLLFSPGACYIVSSAQIRAYPVNLYKNLLKVINYTYFPSEAYIVERMLNIIFLGNYELQDYMHHENLFDLELARQESIKNLELASPKDFVSKWVNMKSKIIKKINYFGQKIIKY